MAAAAPPRFVDYLCNYFLPERQAVWDGSITSAGIPLKVRRDPTDSFSEVEEMVARMDELGIATVCIPTCDIGDHGTLSPYDFEHVAARWEEMKKLVDRYPGRFVSLLAPAVNRGMAGVRDARRHFDKPWVVGFYLHTHSWDRRLDHADYYPYYALAGDTGVPFLMQAGTSGGMMASECGHPVGIDRPALYFRDTNFVLSHYGWPWTEEAIAMALKFPNVFLGTAAYPPRHWPASVRQFILGPGRHKTLFGSNFPVVGHRHAFRQLPELELTDEATEALLGGTARTIFHRIPAATAIAHEGGSQ